MSLTHASKLRDSGLLRKSDFHVHSPGTSYIFLLGHPQKRLLLPTLPLLQAPFPI